MRTHAEQRLRSLAEGFPGVLVVQASVEASATSQAFGGRGSWEADGFCSSLKTRTKIFVGGA
jgi:hypothetical protein